jgi:regulator of replication initiation timing
MEADEKTLILKLEKEKTTRLTLSENSKDAIIENLKNELSGQINQISNLKTEMTLRIQENSRLKTENKNFPTLKTEPTCLTVREISKQNISYNASLGPSEDPVPSFTTLDKIPPQSFSKLSDQKLTSDNSKFFKGKVFLRKVMKGTQENADSKKNKRLFRHASSQSATCEDFSVATSILRNRAAKDGLSKTLDGNILAPLKGGSMLDELNQADASSNPCFQGFKRQLIASMKAKSQKLSEENFKLNSLQEFIQWQTESRRQEIELLRKNGLLEDYCKTQNSQGSSTLGLLALGVKAQKKNQDSKVGKARLLRALNEGPEYHLMFWGDSRHGKTGVKGQELITVPTYFSGGPFKSLALGSHSSIAVDSKGRLFSWGRGDMLGTQSTDRRTPMLVKSLATRITVQVACGETHCLCLTADGSVFSWVSFYD